MVAQSFLTALLFWSAPVRGAFQASDMAVVDHERLLDDEYFLDLTSFAPPLAWEQESSRSTAAASYRINAASLDCCDLMIGQRALLERRLNRGLAFRFLFTQRGDKDKDETHHWVELEQAVLGGFSALLFGEPTFNKEDSDVGIGLAWSGEAVRVEARRNFVDFSFNKRGPAGQSYSQQPLTDEIVARAGDAALYASIDHPTRRNAFFYRRSTAGLRWEPESWALGYEYEYQRKADGAGLDNKRWAHYFSAGRLWKGFEAGSRLISRRSRNLGAQYYRRWEAQPYLRWREELKPWLDSELASFIGFGEKETRTLVEAKLGAGLDFKFGSAGRIGVYGTFDLDEAGTHFWDGGNVRAMLFF